MMIPVEIAGTLTEMDDSLLRRSSGTIETDVEHTTWVEYCLLACADPVHQGTPPAQTAFYCPHRVHRSVSVYLKRGVLADGVAASFPSST